MSEPTARVARNCSTPESRAYWEGLERLAERVREAGTDCNTPIERDSAAALRSAEIMQALLALKRGSCWCEMAVGTPYCNGHSSACLRAQELTGERA